SRRDPQQGPQRAMCHRNRGPVRALSPRAGRPQREAKSAVTNVSADFSQTRASKSGERDRRSRSPIYPSSYRLAVGGDGASQAQEDGVGDQGVADVELGDLGEGHEGGDVLLRQAVAGGHFEVARSRAPGSLREARELALVAVRVLPRVFPRVLASV